MITPAEIYSITTISFIIPWLFLWISGNLSTGKMIIFLFFFDIVLTIEAGINSNVILIALLHVITIPVFFGLIYFDLIEENKAKFSCFVCGMAIAKADSVQTVKRSVNGRHKSVLVHAACIDLQHKDRKTFSRRKFRSGIPE
jgi:hypothetical protein